VIRVFVVVLACCSLLLGAGCNRPRLSVTAEPEVTVVCVRSSAIEGCIAARGLIGYGSLGGAAASPSVTAARAEGLLLGGAGRLGLVVRVSSFLSFQADGSLGWAWAPAGTIDGVRSASLGGVFFRAQLGVAFGRGHP